MKFILCLILGHSADFDKKKRPKVSLAQVFEGRPDLERLLRVHNID